MIKCVDIYRVCDVLLMVILLPPVPNNVTVPVNQCNLNVEIPIGNTAKME